MGEETTVLCDKCKWTGSSNDLVNSEADPIQKCPKCGRSGCFVIVEETKMFPKPTPKHLEYYIAIVRISGTWMLGGMGPHLQKNDAVEELAGMAAEVGHNVQDRRILTLSLPALPQDNDNSETVYQFKEKGNDAKFRIIGYTRDDANTLVAADAISGELRTVARADIEAAPLTIVDMPAKVETMPEEPEDVKRFHCKICDVVKDVALDALEGVEHVLCPSCGVYMEPVAMIVDEVFGEACGLSDDVPTPNELERRHLSLDLCDEQSNDDQVSFRIIGQTHSGDDFTPCAGSIFVHDDIILRSVSCPVIDVEGDENCLYVQGSNGDADDTVLTCSRELFNQFEEAVAAYNEAFGGNSNA